METLEEYVQTTSGFRVVDHKVKFYGYCKECQMKMSME